MIALLANHPFYEHMGQRFRRGGSGIEPTTVAIVVLAVAVSVLALWALSRFVGRRDRQAYRSPRALFRELAAAHRLDRAQRRLLRRIARCHRLAHPARMFVEPARFDAAVLPASISKDRQALETLRDRLFGKQLQTAASV